MARPNRKFDLVSEFKGYRHREDITNLLPGIMVPGSQNVLTNVSERVGIRKGYTLYGQANTTGGPILGSYDWRRHTGDERHLRSFDDKIQYLFVDSTGIVTWRDLVLSPTASPRFNFTEFWDTLELKSMLLFVNGQSAINEWSGGIATIASNTVNTLTKQGTTTWAQEGFYENGTRRVIINGVAYAYTGGENTTTLTGLAALPAFPVGSVAHQEIRTTTNGAMSGINASFKNDIIANRINHIYVGSLTSNQIYLSKVDNYKDYTFSTPRLIGEGGIFILDGNAIGFIVQDSDMYVTAGRDLWYKSNFIQTTNTVIDSTDVTVSITFETFAFDRVKTTILQAAQSQAMITKIKNNIAFISNEPSFDLLGKSQVFNGLPISFLNDPTISNISDPIKLDFDAYDFTDGSTLYYRNFTYLAIPQEGLTRIYNHIKEYWEAPQTIPASRYAIIEGELYFHSYQSPQTFKLFEGYADGADPIVGTPGTPIFAKAAFSFQNFGTRANLKRFNEFYIEGYISLNTALTTNIKYEVAGCGTELQYTTNGNDSQVVCLLADDRSLGKKSLGKFSLARTGTEPLADGELPKFRVIKTGSGVDFYEMQVSFQSENDDARWEILAFGPEVVLSDHDNVPIKQ